MVYGARSLDGRDVVIGLVSDGTDDGELRTLREGSTAAALEDRENHCLPMLEELSCGKFKFAVLPCVSDCGVSFPWFRNVAEAMDFAEQLLEGRRRNR